MKTSTNQIESALALFKQYKSLGEKAINQLTDDELFHIPAPESNSIYLIVKHMSGNMQSRWTNFLTTDGEKPWRNRDQEFENDLLSKDELMKLWESGWACLLNTLHELTPEQLASIVYIRQEPHTVLEAINRQIAHYAYHIGQIIFIAKLLKADDWQTLSIAKGKSNDFNNNMMK
jgi:hypothetical protein